MRRRSLSGVFWIGERSGARDISIRRGRLAVSLSGLNFPTPTQQSGEVSPEETPHPPSHAFLRPVVAAPRRGRPALDTPPPKVVTIGGAQATRLLKSCHFSPCALRFEAGEEFSAMRLKPSPMLDSWCLARLCGDGCFPLAEHASQTSPKTITFPVRLALMRSVSARSGVLTDQHVSLLSALARTC